VRVSVEETQYPQFVVQHRDRKGQPTGYAEDPEAERLAVDELARQGHRLPVGVRIDVDDAETLVSTEEIAAAAVRHFGRG
jgi:hypothetical protein